jgi:hypothetical protein
MRQLQACARIITTPALLPLNGRRLALHCDLTVSCCRPPSIRFSTNVFDSLPFADYPFDDIPSVLAKGTRNYFQNVVENRDGIADFLSSTSDESARALGPLLRHCMLEIHSQSQECRRTES